MMNTYENCVREFAYQIWESEGRPVGQEARHWEMACKLAQGLNNDDSAQMGSGQVLSVIAPEEPFNPDSSPTIDPPAEPIAPIEDPSRISPTPPPQPIHPTDPVQPDNPAKPIQPYTSQRTSAATISALDEDGVQPVEKKTKSKSVKTKSRKQGSVIL